MRYVAWALVILIATCDVRAADPPISDIAGRISTVERRMPWLWSPAAEGLSDIPYTYKTLSSRRVLARGGRELPPLAGAGELARWRTLQLERIPLDWSADMRCLSVDGLAPCPAAWDQEFGRQSQRRDALSAEDRSRIDAAREERRQRRRNFWDEFPAAMRFENGARDQLRFSPLPGYKPQRGVRNGLLTAIAGRIWFDPSTDEVTRLEYDLIRDVDEPFLRVPKRAHFEITLTNSTDKHYLPQRIFLRRQVGKDGQTEERTTEFSDFRRFATESTLEFSDTKEP